MKYFTAVVFVASCIYFAECAVLPAVLSGRDVCTIYGDPHMNTFGGDWMTCDACGWQVIVKNRYMLIEGYNYFAFPESSATYMTAVKMTFYDDLTGAVRGYYKANHAPAFPLYNIPTTFTSGVNLLLGSGFFTAVIGSSGGNSAWIYYYPANTWILLRRLRHTYMMTINQPAWVTCMSTGLCVSGCPEVDVADVLGITRGKRDVDQEGDKIDTSACDSKKDYYKTACVFDTMVTKDPEFAVETADAVARMSEEMKKRVTEGPPKVDIPEDKEESQAEEAPERIRQ